MSCLEMLVVVVVVATLAPLVAGEEECTDSSQYCQRWKERGYCEESKYQSYMARNCPLTCFQCCMPDINTRCGAYAQRGYCEVDKYHEWMDRNCHQTCSGCCKEGDFECLVPLMKEKVSSMELQLNRTSMMMMKMTEKMDKMRYEAFIAKNDTDARIRVLEEKMEGCCDGSETPVTKPPQPTKPPGQARPAPLLQDDPMCGQTTGGQAECYFDCSILSAANVSGQVVRELACLEDCFLAEEDACMASLLQDVLNRSTCALESNPGVWGVGGACTLEEEEYESYYDQGEGGEEGGEEDGDYEEYGGAIMVIKEGTCSNRTEELLQTAACRASIGRQQAFIKNTIQLLIQYSCVGDPYAMTRRSRMRRMRRMRSRRVKRDATWYVTDTGAPEATSTVGAGGSRTRMEYEHTRGRYPWLCSLRAGGEHLCAVTLLAVPPGPAVLVGAAHCTTACADNKGNILHRCCCAAAGQRACREEVECGEGAAVVGRPEEGMEVVCGEWQLGKEDGSAVSLAVKEVVRHPDYSISEGPGGGSDIAVFKVEDKELEQYGGERRLYPACLPGGGAVAGLHAGWSRPPPQDFLKNHAAGFLPFYSDFSKLWHYKMEVQGRCRDPLVSATFGLSLAHPSDSPYPAGLLCARDFSRQSCFGPGQGGAPLMAAKDGKLHAEGILSFVKGCDTFTIGPVDETSWQMTRISETPAAYLQLSCFLPWVAAQYGLTYQGPATCAQATGRQATGQACNSTISNLFAKEKECIFPFIYEGQRYEECMQFDEEGFEMPVFRCPVYPSTTKVDGVNSYSFVGLTDGHCLTADKEVDPAMECSPWFKVAPFSQCKNSCPGVRAFGL